MQDISELARSRWASNKKNTQEVEQRDNLQ